MSPVVKPTVLQFLGRKLSVPRSAGKTALFSFAELCEKVQGCYLAKTDTKALHQCLVCLSGYLSVCLSILQPLSSADYLQLAQNFDTILLKGIPQLSFDSRSAARRFIVLVDTLYDNQVGRAREKRGRVLRTGVRTVCAW